MKRYNREDDTEWQDVSEMVASHTGTMPHRDTCRRQSKYLFDLMDGGYVIIPPTEETIQNKKDNASVGYDGKSGTYTYDRLIEICEGEIITPELIMQKHNIDPTKWKVVTYKNNYWNAQNKADGKIIMYQSKVVVKPIDSSEITYEDIDEYFANKDFTTKPKVKLFPIHDDCEDSLEIAYADNHLGLLSWNGETGSDYDIHIAEERFKATFIDILQRSLGKKYKLINFVTLGDILHIDNLSNTTTKGTPQDTDGRLTKIFSAAVDLMCECIDMLLDLQCPIKYTYTAGNHDTFSGFALAKCIEKVYQNNPNITFDISPNPQKIHIYGNTLVGYCHGNMNKKNLGEWLQKSYRKEFGQCKFAEVHCGHLHSESVKENCGVLIKHLPTICESSLWEHTEGYNSQKGVMCFVYNDKTGLRNTWYTYL